MRSEAAGQNRDGESEAAQTLALAALAYVFEEPERASRFLSVTGFDANYLREHVGDPAFLGGVLDFVLEDETLLIGAATSAGVKPERVSALRHRLPGAVPRD